MGNISVVIPTYNRVDFLVECVESVRKQTKSAKEIIVVDDGSSDSTSQWCMLQQDIIYQQTDRAGPSGARNRGVHVASCDWIAFLDSDDLWLSDHLETLWRVLMSHSNASWAIANSILTNPDLSPRSDVQGFAGAFPLFRNSVRCFRQHFPRQSTGHQWHGDGKKQALLGNWLQPSGLLVQRSTFIALGGFNERLWRCEDLDLLLRLVSVCHATLSLKQTYLWRLGQVNSLAADQHTLALKRNAIAVLGRSGPHLIWRHPSCFPTWTQSLVIHCLDYVVAVILRTANRLENKPALQAVIQSAVAIAHIWLPIFLSRVYLQKTFTEYKIFGLYLSTASALSLTAGFWSLLPYWQSEKTNSAERVSSAFQLNVIVTLLFALAVMQIGPLGSDRSELMSNQLLSAAIFFMVPSIFLEHNLAYNRHAFLAALVAAALDVAKIVGLVFLMSHGAGINTLFLAILISSALRFVLFLLGNIKFKILQLSSINLINSFPVLRQAIPASLAAAVVMGSATFERFFLSTQLDAQQFALVAAALLPMPMVGLVEQSVNQRLLSPLALSLASGDVAGAMSHVRSSVRKISTIAVPTSLCSAVFAPELIRFLYDARYDRAIPYLVVFSLSHVGACLPADIFARAQGESKRIFYFGIANCGFVCSAVVLGYHIEGAFGAVCAAVFSLLASKVLMLSREAHRVGFSCLQLFKQAIHLKFLLFFAIGLTLLKALTVKFATASVVTLALAALYFVVALLLERHMHQEEFET